MPRYTDLGLYAPAGTDQVATAADLWQTAKTADQAIKDRASQVRAELLTRVNEARGYTDTQVQAARGYTDTKVAAVVQDAADAGEAAAQQAAGPAVADALAGDPAIRQGALDAMTDLGDEAVVGAVQAWEHYPESFGAAGDGQADDTADLQAALDEAAAKWDQAQAAGFLMDGVKMLCVLSGAYRITDTITWDMAKVRIDGRAHVRCDITTPGQFALAPFSSDAFGMASPHFQRNGGMYGVMWIGNDICNGWELEGGSGKELAHTQFVGCMIQNFRTGLYLSDHSYMLSWLRCSIQGNRLGIKHIYPVANSNSGERYEFTDCDITGNDWAVDAEAGQAFHFIGCSFSFNHRGIARSTNSQLYLTQCHIEMDNPLDAGFELIERNACVFLTDCRILLSGTFTPVGGPSPTIATDGTITCQVRHKLEPGDQVDITVLSGATGLTTGRYWVIETTDTTLKIAYTEAGESPIQPSTSGTVRVTRWSNNPLIRFGNAACEAKIKGGHISGSSRAPYLSTGPGKIDVHGTVTYQFTPYSPSVNDQTFAIRNGHFDEPSMLMDLWEKDNPSDTLGTSTARPHTGTRSLRFNRNDPGGGDSFVYLYIPISDGARVLTKYWHHVPDGVTVGVWWTWVGENKAIYGAPAASTAISGDGTWQRQVQPSIYWGSAPTWARYLAMRWNMKNVPQGESVFLDDFEVSTF